VRVLQARRLHRDAPRGSEVARRRRAAALRRGAPRVGRVAPLLAALARLKRRERRRGGRRRRRAEEPTASARVLEARRLCRHAPALRVAKARLRRAALLLRAPRVHAAVDEPVPHRQACAGRQRRRRGRSCGRCGRRDGAVEPAPLALVLGARPMRSHDAPRVVAVARGRRAPALVLTRGAEPGGRRPAPLLCALARRQGRRRRRRRRRQRRRRGAGEAACPIDVLRARRGHRLAPRRTAIARWLGAAALVDAAAEAKDVWPAPPLLAGAGRQRGRAAWRRRRRQRGRGRRGQGWRTTGGRRRQVRRRSRRRQRRRGRRRRRRRRRRVLPAAEVCWLRMPRGGGERSGLLTPANCSSRAAVGRSCSVLAPASRRSRAAVGWGCGHAPANRRDGTQVGRSRSLAPANRRSGAAGGRSRLAPAYSAAPVSEPLGCVRLAHLIGRVKRIAHTCRLGVAGCGAGGVRSHSADVETAVDIVTAPVRPRASRRLRIRWIFLSTRLSAEPLSAQAATVHAAALAKGMAVFQMAAVSRSKHAVSVLRRERKRLLVLRWRRRPWPRRELLLCLVRQRPALLMPGLRQRIVGEAERSRDRAPAVQEQKQRKQEHWQRAASTLRGSAPARNGEHR